MIDVPDILDLGSDRVLRRRLFCKASFEHPAKLNLHLLAWLVEQYTRPGDTICDPMAGIGSLLYAALLQRNVVVREVEPDWLALAHENAARVISIAGLFAGAIDVGEADAREPWHIQADCILFSPPYGCETGSERQAKGILSHKQRLLAEQPGTLGKRWRSLLANEQKQAGSAGSMRFHYGASPAQVGHLRGARYWEAMGQIYTQAHAALRPGGKMILVIKDHIRNGQRVHIVDETAARCAAIGFRLVARHARKVYPLSLWQRRRKEKGEPIVEEEDVLVFEVQP